MCLEDVLNYMRENVLLILNAGTKHYLYQIPNYYKLDSITWRKNDSYRGIRKTSNLFQIFDKEKEVVRCATTKLLSKIKFLPIHFSKFQVNSWIYNSEHIYRITILFEQVRCRIVGPFVKWFGILRNSCFWSICWKKNV